MTVSQMIEWLKTQDQGAVVNVVVHKADGGNYYLQGGVAQTAVFTPELTEYTDLRGNQFVTPDKPYYNQRTLLIGQYNE